MSGIEHEEPHYGIFDLKSGRSLGMGGGYRERRFKLLQRGSS